jgi:hypothetical protein
MQMITNPRDGIYAATPDHVHAMAAVAPKRQLYEKRSLRRSQPKARFSALGGKRIPTTAIVVETLLPEWLVEIEPIVVA